MLCKSVASGGIMRRWLARFVPLVLLAIVVQLFAPIAAFRAVAYASSDPLYMASICSGMTSTDSTTTPSKTEHAHDDCCAFCAGGHGGANLLDPPAPVFVSLQRDYQLVSWLEASEPMPVIRTGSNAQARAPPVIS
jgi:Protein of unknown function (DUF2946)